MLGQASKSVLRGDLLCWSYVPTQYTIVRFPNNGKSVAATLQWRLSLEHELSATQSRTTYRPSKLTVRHVCQRLSHERQGARLCLCQPQTDPMKNIGLATDTTVRLVRKRLQIEIQRQLLDRFKRSDRDSLIHSASVKVFNGCKIGTRAMGDNQACMVRYRYEPADGSIQMVDLPGIAHLYMSANHQEDGQPPITALITQEAAATLSKSFKVESFTNLLIQICQEIWTSLRFNKWLHRLRSWLKGHVDGFPTARRPNRASLVVFDPF